MKKKEMYTVTWEDVSRDSSESGKRKFNSYNEASDFYNSKIDEFYEGIDDGSDHNGLSYTDYVKDPNGLDFEIEDGANTFTAFKRGYYNVDHFEISIN